MNIVELAAVATIDRQTVDPSEIDPNTSYLGLEHIERGGRILRTSTVAAAELTSAKFLFGPSHVLFGKLRPNLAKITRPNFGGVCSTDILPIRPGASLDRDYLAHYLLQPSMVAYAATRASGANLPRLSPSVLGGFPIPLPSMEEQRRIAAVLDAADAIRLKRKAVLGRLYALRSALFLDMFGHLEASVQFGEVISDGPSNGLYKPAADYGSGSPILRIDGFGQGVMYPERWQRVRLAENEVSRFGLQPDDIVINRVNALSHLGKSALVRDLREPSVYESNMMRLRVDSRKVLPDFIVAWMQTDSYKRQVLRKAKKAINQASINQTDVRSLMLAVPPVDAQRMFAARAERIDAQRAAVQRALTADDELFASLQSRAFSGKL